MPAGASRPLARGGLVMLLLWSVHVARATDPVVANDLAAVTTSVLVGQVGLGFAGAVVGNSIGSAGDGSQAFEGTVTGAVVGSVVGAQAGVLGATAGRDLPAPPIVGAVAVPQATGLALLALGFESGAKDSFWLVPTTLLVFGPVTAAYLGTMAVAPDAHVRVVANPDPRRPGITWVGRW